MTLDVLDDLEPFDADDVLSDSDEKLLANITRASSPDSFSGSDSAGRGAALVKRPWLPEEDELLIAAVRKYGACRWSMIATQLETGRVGKQCRERWNNHLCPEVKKSEWSEEEDRAIMQGVAVLGTRWCEIVKAPPLSGRTDNAIKNRFYSLQRRMKARLTGGHRAGRRAQGPAGSEDEAPPLCQTDRIMAIATELAFATDECERDKLIEQLTDTLHENTPEHGLDEDSGSDIGPLESPDALSGLAAMSKSLCRKEGRGRGGLSALGLPLPAGMEEDDAPASRADALKPLAPPTPVHLPLKSNGFDAPEDDDDEADDEADEVDSPAGALEPSVSNVVADLLRLPLSPKTTPADAAPPRAGGTIVAATAVTCVSQQPTKTALTVPAKLPPLSPGHHAAGADGAAEADDASSVTTISPDGAGGALVDQEAWRVPDQEPTAAPPAASAADNALKDKTLADRNTPPNSAERRGRPRSRSAFEAHAASPNGCGGASPNGPDELRSAHISATVLGGRHAYKAFLAPLRVPAEQLLDVDSPKRMRTPNGPSSLSAGRQPTASGLRACTVVTSGGTAASVVAAAAPPPLARAATGTEEPSAPRAAAASHGVVTLDGLFSPTSPMSELLNLSIFTDLFADESQQPPAKAAAAACLSHTDSLDSEASTVVAAAPAPADDADVPMDDATADDATADDATAPKVLSPETGGNSTVPAASVKLVFGACKAPKADVVPSATRRSARASARAVPA